MEFCHGSTSGQLSPYGGTQGGTGEVCETSPFIYFPVVHIQRIRGDGFSGSVESPDDSSDSSSDSSSDDEVVEFLVGRYRSVVHALSQGWR
jgi:hypothetical protein